MKKQTLDRFERIEADEGSERQWLRGAQYLRDRSVPADD
jgi:hypothetical protein